MLKLLTSLACSFLFDCPTEWTCADDVTNCSPKDCAMFPGYTYTYCKRTCGNCDGRKCNDSPLFPCESFQEVQCAIYPEIRDYCPMLCRICQASRPPTSLPLTPPPLLSTTPATPSPNIRRNPVAALAQPAYSLLNLILPNYRDKATPAAFEPPPPPVPRRTQQATTLRPTLQTRWEALGGTATTAASCEDEDPGCTADQCDAKPGRYLLSCRSTCGNCHDGRCFDSRRLRCADYSRQLCSSIPDLFEYCPSLCGTCRIPWPEIRLLFSNPQAFPQPPIQESGSKCLDAEGFSCGRLSNYCHLNSVRHFCPQRCGICSVSPPAVLFGPAYPYTHSLAPPKPSTQPSDPLSISQLYRHK